MAVGGLAGLSIGLVSVGGVAVGLCALGGLAVGWTAAIDGLAVAVMRSAGWWGLLVLLPIVLGARGADEKRH